MNTIRCTTLAETAAAITVAIGFRPAESLTIASPNGMMARVDLPTNTEDAERLSAQMLPLLKRNGVDAVLLMAWTGEITQSDAVLAVCRNWAEEGIRVLHEGVATTEYVHCTVPLCGCTGAFGQPLDLESNRVTAEAVADGRVVRSSREELAATLDQDPEAAARVEVALEPYAESSRDWLINTGVWLAERLQMELLARTGGFTDEELARVLVAIKHIGVRDVAWSSMTHDNVRQLLEVFKDWLRRSPTHLSAAPAALLGFAAWLAGDGALAWLAIEKCRAVDPDYHLAKLLTFTLNNGMPPYTWDPAPMGDVLSALNDITEENR